MFFVGIGSEKEDIQVAGEKKKKKKTIQRTFFNLK